MSPLCRTCHLIGILALLLGAAPVVNGGTLANLTIRPETGDRKGFFTLSWDSTPGLVYRVQKSTSVSSSVDPGNNVNWLFGEARMAVSNKTQVEIPGGTATEFYRLLAMPEIFSVEPMWVDAIDPNSVLYIIGQFLPTNATVIINGQNLTPTVVNTAGVWAYVSLSSFTPGTPLTGSLDVMDNDTGTIVATYKLQSGFIYATQPPTTGRSMQGPPGCPPASPVPQLGKKLYVGNLPFSHDDATRWQSQGIGHTIVVKSAARSVGGGDDDCDGQPDDVFKLMKAKEKANKTKCGNNLRVVNPATGELEIEETDLVLAGRGMDFQWTRTYRSRTGTNTAQGRGWDFSYNVSLTQQPDGTVEICMGNGRCDTFFPNGTNGWARDEYFMEVRDLNSDGMPDVLFADSGKWLFRPFDAADPASGKLESIVDRNGNTITLNYNASGHLSTIVDTLGRTITVETDSVAGEITSVTDFAGRVVRYEYDTNGDLVACISPAVTGTPNGNDFPEGKTNRYTYSSGFIDERLNHNLTSCIDAKGQLSLQINYHTTTEPSSINFDAVASVQRGIEKKDIRRGMVKATPANRFAVTQVIVNDYVGNVSEYFFDSRHRCVRQLDFTGRADPILPTTLIENRPANKLRAEDPDYYETRWSWNADSLCTSETLPGGIQTFFVYEGDFDSNTSPRKKGDLRVMREVACCLDADSDGDGLGDFSERIWRFEHDPRFGSDPIATGGIVPTVAGHAINTKGAGANSGKLAPPKAQHAINTKGAGANAGKIIPTSSAHAINTKGTGAAGRIIIRDIKKPSHRSAARDKEKPFLMPVEDFAPMGFVTSVVDPRGNMSSATFDPQGNCTSVNPRAARDNHLQGGADFVQAWRFAHNSFGQLTTITNAADANGYRRVDTFSHYTNGPALGYVQYSQRDSNGDVCTYSFEYDVRGNVTRITDPRTNDWLFTYNALDQCVRSETPVNITARCATDFTYDANDNLVKRTEDLLDETDKKTGTLSTFAGHDFLDRVISIADQVSSTHFVTNQFTYDGNDNLLGIDSPLAVSGADPHNVVQFQYDERDLLYRTIFAPGSPDQTTDQFDYTPSGKLGAANGGIEAPGRITTYEYDGLDRCVVVTDAMGNVTTYAYDRTDNLVRARMDAEMKDLEGKTGNLRYHDWTWRYDLQGLCVESSIAFFDPATQTPLAGGSAITSFSYAPNGQLISETDPKSNTTFYSYDTVGRLATITDPKTNVVAFTYDKTGNIVSITENERSDLSPAVQQFTTTSGYDYAHRLTRCVDNVGNTNEYAYDSRGNLVRHVDPKGLLTFTEFDGLGRQTLASRDWNLDGMSDASDLRQIFVWDDNDRLISMTDANTNLTQYAYDSRNRCVSITEADGTSCSLVWSPRSNLRLRQDANGTVISNSFDLLDRCVRRDIVPASGVAATTTFEEFAYDGLSRVVLASNDVSRVEFSYDSMGNTTRETQGGWDVLLIHDQNGNRTSMTYPGGGVVTYTYDALNQPLTVMGPPLVNGAPPVLLASFGYEGPGRVGRVARGNGINTRITWNGMLSPANAAGDFGSRQVSTINHQVSNGGTTIDRRTSAYDRNQNKILRAQLQPFAPGGDMSTNIFDYDPLNRVRLAIKTKGTSAHRVAYDLDGNGNRKTVIVTENDAPEIQNYSMDATLPVPGDFQMDQYTTTPFSAQQFDANGNLFWKDSGDLAFVSDFANRLVSVQSMASGTLETVVSFAYDALGRRISKTTYLPAPLEPATVNFIYDGSNIIEMHEGGVTVATFILDGTQSRDPEGSARTFTWTQTSGPYKFTSRSGNLVVRGAGQEFYFHTDELGNVLALTDATGGVVERYDYDDYGTPDFLNADGGPLTGSDGLPINFSPTGNPFLFHGMFWDEETELYFSNSDGTPLLEWTFEKGWPCRYEGPRYFDAATGRYIMRAGVPLRFSPANSFSGDNPWTLKKEEGGRHTPFHNKASYGGMTGIGHSRYATGGTIGAGQVSDILRRKGTVKFFNETKGFGLTRLLESIQDESKGFSSLIR